MTTFEQVANVLATFDQTPYKRSGWRIWEIIFGVIVVIHSVNFPEEHNYTALKRKLLRNGIDVYIYNPCRKEIFVLLKGEQS